MGENGEEVIRFIAQLRGGGWAELAEICQPTFRVPISRQLRLFVDPL